VAFSLKQFEIGKNFKSKIINLFTFFTLAEKAIKVEVSGHEVQRD